MVRKISLILLYCITLTASELRHNDTVLKRAASFEFVVGDDNKKCLEVIYGAAYALNLLEWLKTSEATLPEQHKNIAAIRKQMCDTSDHIFEGYAFMWGIHNVRQRAKMGDQQYREWYVAKYGR